MASQPPANETKEKFSLRLSQIGAARALIEARKAPDNIDRIGQLRLDVEHKKAELDNKWLLIDLRKKFGRNVIRFMWFYFFFAFAIVVADGFGLYGMKLPDNVLIALIGGTAVSVLGVVGTIASGLFKPPEPPTRP